MRQLQIIYYDEKLQKKFTEQSTRSDRRLQRQKLSTITFSLSTTVSFDLRSQINDLRFWMFFDFMILIYLYGIPS